MDRLLELVARLSESPACDQGQAACGEVKQVEH